MMSSRCILSVITAMSISAKNAAQNTGLISNYPEFPDSSNSLGFPNCSKMGIVLRLSILTRMKMQELDVWERFEWRKFESFIRGQINHLVLESQRKYEQAETVVLLTLIRHATERLLWFDASESCVRKLVMRAIEEAISYTARAKGFNEQTT